MVATTRPGTYTTDSPALSRTVISSAAKGLLRSIAHRTSIPVLRARSITASIAR